MPFGMLFERGDRRPLDHPAVQPTRSTGRDASRWWRSSGNAQGLQPLLPSGSRRGDRLPHRQMPAVPARVRPRARQAPTQDRSPRLRRSLAQTRSRRNQSATVLLDVRLRGIPTRRGFDRDEYPPALSDEGGRGAHVRYVKSSEKPQRRTAYGRAAPSVLQRAKLRLRTLGAACSGPNARRSQSRIQQVSRLSAWFGFDLGSHTFGFCSFARPRPGYSV